MITNKAEEKVREIMQHLDFDFQLEGNMITLIIKNGVFVMKLDITDKVLLLVNELNNK